MSDENSGCGCGSILFVWLTLIALKCFGILNLSWLVVILVPIWLPLAIAALVLILALGFILAFLSILMVIGLVMLIVLVPAAIIISIFEN